MTSFTAQCRPVLLSQSLRHIEFSNRCGQWTAFGDPLICVFACCARRRLWKHNRLHLFTLTGVPRLDSQFLREETRTRCEVAQELIFRISRCSPKLIQEIKPPARCWWLSPHRALSGYSVTATTEVFVADLRLPRSSPTTACPTYLLCPSLRLLWPKSSPRSTQIRPRISCSWLSQMEFVLVA